MEVTATVLIQQHGDTFVDCDHIVDGAGHRFVAYGEQLGNETWATIKRYAPNGTVTGVWTVFPTANHKIDEVTLAHSGDVLLVLLTTHEIVSNKPRSIRVESAAIPGVYSVRAGMELEEGGAGAFQPTGEPQPQEGGVTKDEVQAIVNAAVAQIKGQDNVTLKVVIDNILPKTKIGVEQLFDGANGSHVVYQQLRATSYSGALDAIRESESPVVDNP